MLKFSTSLLPQASQLNIQQGVFLFKPQVRFGKSKIPTLPQLFTLVSFKTQYAVAIFRNMGGGCDVVQWQSTCFKYQALGWIFSTTKKKTKKTVQFSSCENMGVILTSFHPLNYEVLTRLFPNCVRDVFSFSSLISSSRNLITPTSEKKLFKQILPKDGQQVASSCRGMFY